MELDSVSCEVLSRGWVESRFAQFSGVEQALNQPKPTTVRKLWCVCVSTVAVHPQQINRLSERGTVCHCAVDTLVWSQSCLSPPSITVCQRNRMSCLRADRWPTHTAKVMSTSSVRNHTLIHDTHKHNRSDTLTRQTQMNTTGWKMRI